MIRQKIQSRTIFTEAEKSVAGYILEKPQDVLDMGVRDLAQATFTSAPTVLRVCRKLDCAGFNELKKALLIDLENEKHFPAEVDASIPFLKSEKPNRIIGSLSSLYKESVESTAAMLKVPEVSQIADNIVHANRLFLYALGDSQITCRLFANKLLKLDIHPILAAENGQEMEETYNLRQDDYALFVTYKGIYPRFVSCAAILKRRKVKSGVITCNAESPLVTLCANTIQIPDAEQVRKIASFQSQISLGFALNVIYSFIYESDYERHERHKSVLDAVSYYTHEEQS